MVSLKQALQLASGKRLEQVIGTFDLTGFHKFFRKISERRRDFFSRIEISVTWRHSISGLRADRGDFK
jgi:hypothetical protein